MLSKVINSGVLIFNKLYEVHKVIIFIIYSLLEK